MSTAKLLPRSRPLPSLSRLNLHQSPRRTFLPNPSAILSPLTSGAPQTLTTTRTLPYPSTPIYTVISDIQSYSQFLPYCLSSTVTKWSAPDKTYNKRWPSEGKLEVGWKGITESFTTRVFCIPGQVVESIGGSAVSSLPSHAIAHHTTEQERRHAGEEEERLLSHLLSRWELTPLGQNAMKVTLALEFAFANPIYSALSAGAAPKVADIMVKAFEDRVREVVERDPGLLRRRLGDVEAGAGCPS
ncbi:uncharacterized protein EI97DRAFT_428797 [Westerdykella ornata]|uniref:Coenzyme Q-binding protein COQ10 START domain-containing protein n=1 Tax=Westerdykella ornata TaxID=318751 RepID=A0A6A6JVR6_WESOR|nr:uncharacterized protein EI97DRAFT_428797 [Westerdykella ornata]KAF2280692.1 hypothetical protein EI97DRAFT_428797 [Westerdykella ornata]